jgi:ABC-type nickel/cobalt efflux system permease component RcnA
MSPGAVLVGLLLGPATNVATIGFLKKSYGTRAAVVAIVALVASAWGLAFALEASGLTVAPAANVVMEHTHGWLTYAAAILCAAVLLRGIWRHGSRLALDARRVVRAGAHHHHDLDPHDHDHDHDREHGGSTVAMGTDR